MSYNFSYSSIEDVYATAHDEQDKETKDHLLNLAQDLEQMGTGWFQGTEYVMHDGGYGPEVLSMEDFLSEQEDE